MVLRFFGFIWGAILLTLVLFAALIAALQLTAPESAQRALERQILVRQLSALAEAVGSASALEVWSELAVAHPGFVVAPDSTCAAETVIRDRAETCLSILDLSPPGGIFEQVRPLILPLGLGIVVSSLAAIILSQWLTRPIRTVSHGLKTLAGGKLDVRIQPDLNTTNPELAELGASFDNAAARLQELADSRRRLFHDISHEIRSPLARLRAAVGLLAVNPARFDTMLGQMETDIGRLDHLVDEILTLARFEENRAAPSLEAVDLVDVLDPIVADASFEGQARNVTLRYEGPERLLLQANVELLHRACENVIRNAVRHSPQGGTVLIRGGTVADAVFLEVADEGPGVAEEDLSKLFLPFVRLSLGDAAGGVGLGLAIAAQAILAHGGTIEARRGELIGLVVVIRVPTQSGRRQGAAAGRERSL